MISLAIDTSNQGLALGILADQTILASQLINIKKTHSEQLMPSIDFLVKSAGLTIQDIDRFIVAQGPGSYTGVRIGVTTAKALAFTLQKELVGVSSLASLAANVLPTDQLIVPLFNARRSQVFAGIYQWQAGRLVEKEEDQHQSLDDLLATLKNLNQPATFVGSDVITFEAEIKAGLPQLAHFASATANLPSGISLARLGQDLPPVKDIDNFVPIYLRQTEAETNWLKNHQVTGHETYVEEV